jgi:hypothetical protein
LVLSDAVDIVDVLDVSDAVGVVDVLDVSHAADVVGVLDARVAIGCMGGVHACQLCSHGEGNEEDVDEGSQQVEEGVQHRVRALAAGTTWTAGRRGCSAQGPGTCCRYHLDSR